MRFVWVSVMQLVERTTPQRATTVLLPRGACARFRRAFERRGKAVESDGGGDALDWEAYADAHLGEGSEKGSQHLLS